MNATLNTFDIGTIETHVERLSAAPLLTLAPTRKPLNYQVEFNRIKHVFYLKDKLNEQALGKRAFDILFSLMALAFFSPIFLAVALWIRLASPEGAIFYSQQRLGRNGELFPCYKFRTMVPDADQRLRQMFDEKPELEADYLIDYKLKHDPRIIPGVGHFLRKTSLDELPQFFNVLRGDMSVVGPRPIVTGELFKYGRYMSYLFLARPGITGPWQTGGRNNTSYRRRVAHDLLYIKHPGLLKDLRIVFKTVQVMLTRDGAY